MSAGFNAVIEQIRQAKIQHLLDDLEFFRNEPRCEEDAAALENELKELQIIA
jgi:hypothetical protein